MYNMLKFVKSNLLLVSLFVLINVAILFCLFTPVNKFDAISGWVIAGIGVFGRLFVKTNK